MSDFPTSVPTLPTNYADNVDDVMAANQNEPNDEINAIGGYIGASGNALFTGRDAKTTPVDSDVVGLNDSAASDVLKKTTWANIKATLKSYFDTLYPTGGVGAWAGWTPAWTNLTVGNASLNAGYYCQIGKAVHFRVALIFGSTTSVSGDITLTLPVAAASYGGNATFIGQCILRDATGSYYFGAIANAGGIRIFNASATYLTLAICSSTAPFTWTTSDEIEIMGTYEAA